MSSKASVHGYDSFRKSSSATKKVYEEMLFKELTGTKRSNQPMHAVLESSVDDVGTGKIMESQRVRNHALIHYLASLANSNSNDDKFDFDFVESLINNGADINSTDKNGQTIFHEVARSWNLDVAAFLIEQGADLNKQDKFGRSPLHVAAAVDYAEMVQYLVTNGADINIATLGEGQMPIHYAAKNDGCRSLKMLLGYDANIDSRDSKNRAPLQVAAEMNRHKAAKFLIQHGAPAGVQDSMGNSALALLIDKLPDVSVEALDQFHSVSTINGKEYFFLNYLEGNRLIDPKSPAYSALEVAVQHQEFDVILHPVMQRLIFTKWQKFGRFGAMKDLVLNLLYAVLWTVMAVTTPAHGGLLYTPLNENAWRLVISISVCIMTVDEIRKQLTGILRTRRRQQKWITWRASELEQELAYCHPRWPQEQMYLKSEIEATKHTPLISGGDAWIYFDWFSLALILATIASHLAYQILDTNPSRVVYLRIITVLLLVLWIRILKYGRPFEGIGPFVVIFGHIIKDIYTWGTLLIIIAVPFGCAFWITFGKISENPVESYSHVSPLLYNLFSMLVVNDHDFEAMEERDSSMARILCGLFIGFMAVVHLNILIALLSETFSRVYANAVANAIMQRAKTILLIEKSLGSKKKITYQEFIKNNCSPEVVDINRDMTTNSERDNQKSSEILQQRVEEIHLLLTERIGKHFGKGQSSDFDLVRQSITDIHESNIRQQEDLDTLKQHLHQMQVVLSRMGRSLNVDVQDLDYLSSNADDGSVPPALDASRGKSFLDGSDQDGSPDRKLSPEQRHTGEGIRNEAYEGDFSNSHGKSPRDPPTRPFYQDERTQRRDSGEHHRRRHGHSPPTFRQPASSRANPAAQRGLRDRDASTSRQENPQSRRISRDESAQGTSCDESSQQRSRGKLSQRRSRDNSPEIPYKAFERRFRRVSSGLDDGQEKKGREGDGRGEIRQGDHKVKLQKLSTGNLERHTRGLNARSSRQQREPRYESDEEMFELETKPRGEPSAKKLPPKWDDDQVIAYSDSESRHRRRSSENRRYYEDWDSRSAKSVAF